MEYIFDALKIGIIPGIIAATYLIIIRLLDNRKDSKQIKVTEQLVTAINNLNNFVNNVTKNIIDTDKDKARACINASFYACCAKINKIAITEIINNTDTNLNREHIIYNIHNVVKSEYYTIYCTLAMFTINNVNISNILKECWINEIEENVYSIIFNNTLNSNEKILQLMTRLETSFNNYVTYIINKGLK